MGINFLEVNFLQFTHDLFLYNSRITEWDITKANVSLMRYYNLYPLGKISRLERLPKSKREVEVGILCRDDKQFNKALSKSFNDIMVEFLEANGLDKDEDVVSIKKDAAFVINKDIKQSVFGPVRFLPKNEYRGFVKLDRYEFYLKSDYTFDVKGWSKAKDIHLHDNGMLDFLREVFLLCDNYQGDKNVIGSYLSKFADAYKRRQLEFDYYRPFNDISAFDIDFGDGNVVRLDNIDETYINEIDISYNYLKLFLPLMRKLI